MRASILCLMLLASAGLTAQVSPVREHATQPNADVRAALAGDWVGVLEYRDYHEAADSLKRVDLPTWLAIRDSGTAQTWHYVYDDGPGKTVDSTETVTLDAAKKTYQSASDGKPPQTSAVAGFETLKQGYGVLIITGSGNDNDKPAEMRITLTVRRNLLELLQEVRPAGSDAAYSFRHLYRMVRSTIPAVTEK